MNDFKHIIKLIKSVNKLNKQEFSRIEPIIRQAMASGIQDMNYLEKILDALDNILFASGIGQELCDEFLNYIESFNPKFVKKYRDYNDERDGVYDDLITESRRYGKGVS